MQGTTSVPNSLGMIATSPSENVEMVAITLPKERVALCCQLLKKAACAECLVILPYQMKSVDDKEKN